MNDIERFDKIHAIQRKRYIDMQSTDPARPETIDFISFILERSELLWLIGEMESIADEHSKRTGKPISEDTIRRIKTIKRLSSFFDSLQIRFDHQEVEIAELNRKLEYYKRLFPDKNPSWWECVDGIIKPKQKGVIASALSEEVDFDKF